MRLPAPLLVAAILFWGWQTGMWVVAVPVAIVMAGPRYLPLRWELSNAQLYRVADFCTVLVALLAGYLYISFGNPRAVVLLFQWLPVVLLPLALAHAYGTAERIDLGVLVWTLRRGSGDRPRGFDPSFPYFALWLMAASAANMRDEWFYAGLALLVAWPLVMLRPLSYPVGTWATAFSCAVAIGYGVHYGLHELQLWLEGVVPDWIAGTGTRTDPYRSMTDIGHIGELKQSDAIVLRVTGDGGLKPPRLLHRASYNVYAGASWIAHGAPFSAVFPAQQRGGWMFAPGKRPRARIVIHDYSAQTNPVLSLPAGTVALEQLQAQKVSRNVLGAVQIERAPGFFSYVAAFAPADLVELPPGPDDLRIARAEGEAFPQLAEELKLAGLPPAAAVEKVQRFFRDHFRYATFQKERPRDASPILDFMRRTRAGHCEYFATATVMLLRAAGIPARYATGFAVQEYSALEGAYLVRARHAHSWARVYIDAAWIDVDTTPPGWFDIEAGTAPIWSAALDFGSWLRFRAAQAWSQSDGRTLTVAALAVTLPFALWLAFRLHRSRRIIQRPPSKIRGRGATWTGADSEFYLIERRLAERGWARRGYETAGDWIKRLRAEAPVDSPTLAEIVELHYRYRFDPSGLTPDERLRLKQAAANWLERNAVRTS